MLGMLRMLGLLGMYDLAIMRALGCGCVIEDICVRIYVDNILCSRQYIV